MSKRSFPDGQERFLDRWARRKREAEEGVDEGTAPAAAAPADGAVRDEGVREEDLPDIDELGADSDYSAFMRAGVSPDLRTRALRALWRSDPSRFAPDGLEEYGGDHRTSPVMGAAVKTVFKVARGSVSESDPAPDAPREDDAADDEPEASEEDRTPGDAEA